MFFGYVVAASTAAATMDSSRATYLVVLIGALAWCAAIILAPALAATTGRLQPIGEFLYRFFHPICHQLDNRSLHLFGGALGVCSRCSAIYFSFLGGTLAYPLVRDLRSTALPHRIILAAGLIPLVVDGLVGGGILYHTTLGIRLVTGAVAGATLPFYILPAAIEGAGQIWNERLHHLTDHTQKGMDDA